MKITILQIGKTKQPFFQDSEQEYLKRLQPYAKVQMITLKEGQGLKETAAQKEIIKQQEAKEILQHLSSKTLIIALDEHGKTFSSPEFAQFIKQKQNSGQVDLTFIIGGAFGLSQGLLKQAHLQLSFSRFTFTHEMIRTLLLEQLYRAFTIIQGKTYHY